MCDRPLTIQQRDQLVIASCTADTHWKQVLRHYWLVVTEQHSKYCTDAMCKYSVDVRVTASGTASTEFCTGVIEMQNV